MKGFGIEIKNNLLEKKHVKAMGISIWLYMWLLDKITSISEEGIGLVLGGKPITYAEVERELGVSQRTYHNWISVLKKYGYIEVIRTPHGLRVSVNKAFKRFNRKTKVSSTPCAWCSRTDLALASHHYPIPRSKGGKETVNICVVCHAIYHSTELPPTDPIYKKSSDVQHISSDRQYVAHQSEKSYTSNKTEQLDNTKDRRSSFSKKKLFYGDKEVIISKGKYLVVMGDGELKEFGGNKKDLVEA